MALGWDNPGQWIEKQSAESTYSFFGRSKNHIYPERLLLHVQGPVREPVGYDSVVELEVEGEVQAENGFCGEINFGGIQMGQAKVSSDRRSGTGYGDGCHWCRLYFSD